MFFLSETSQEQISNQQFWYLFQIIGASNAFSKCSSFNCRKEEKGAGKLREEVDVK